MKYSGLLLSVIWATNLPAAIVDWDFQPGSLGFKAIRHEDNLWLDLTVTRGMAYRDVIAEMEPGGRFNGWRVASADEARGLLNGLGLPTVDGVKGLMQIWGGPFETYLDYTSTAFLVSDRHDVGSIPGRQQGNFGYWPPNHQTMPNGVRVFCCGSGGLFDNQGAPGYGVALVRQIPEPTSLTLCLFAAASVLRRRTRRIKTRRAD